MDKFLNKIIKADCISILKQIPDQSVNLIHTDPPYNISENVVRKQFTRGKGEKVVSYEFGDWDYNYDPEEFTKHAKRIIKTNGNIFIWCKSAQIGQYFELFKEFDTKRVFVWTKTNTVISFQKTDFRHSVEYCFMCWNNGHTWNFLDQGKMKDYFISPSCCGNERLKNPDGTTLHPTQKKLSLIQHLTQIGTLKDMVVLDPYAGTCTTAVACLNLQRQYICIETEDKFVTAGRKRVKEWKLNKSNMLDLIFEEM